MSIDHSFEFTTNQGSQLKINLSNLNADPQNTSDVRVRIYAFDENTAGEQYSSDITLEDLRRLYKYLSRYSIIRDAEVESTGRIIEVTKETEALADLFDHSDRDAMMDALGSIVSSKLSRADINTILGRKSALEQYTSMLGAEHTEPEWQKFFEQNPWIFGYGLNYKYLSILQRESHVSGTNLDGSGSVITDFLLTDKRFTKIVELKKPNTPLFESERNRSDSWRLSKDLTYSVSQILAQKANWEFDSHRLVHDGDGEPIRESTVDVQSILIIGSSTQFEGDSRDQIIKKKTFELYRRNLRNIEILLYDELFERAQFLIDNTET
jgi:hypothetical protein